MEEGVSGENGPKTENMKIYLSLVDLCTKG